MVSCSTTGNKPIEINNEIFKSSKCTQGYRVINSLQYRSISGCLELDLESTNLLVSWLNDRLQREKECMAQPICRMTLALLHENAFILVQVHKKLNRLEVTTELNVPLGKSVTFSLQAGSKQSDKVHEEIISEVVF